jgi:hypothetical protein
MVKHFRSMKGLILVGDKPNWYTGDWIQVRDIIGRTEFSMYMKAMLGSNDEKFLYTTDDHYALEDFDENLPNYYSGTCKEKELNHPHGRFKRLYKNCPEGWLNYDIHVPIVMKKFTWAEPDKPIKSTYANQAGVTGTELNDLKFFNGHSYDQIKSIIDGKPFFSTSPFSQNKDMMRVLLELYPEKSIYEK